MKVVNFAEAKVFDLLLKSLRSIESEFVNGRKTKANGLTEHKHNGL